MRNVALSASDDGWCRNISKAFGFECKVTCLGWLVVCNRELWNAVEPESVLSQ